MSKKYSKEFKLHVINTYIESPHGIRVIAQSFDLPTKNYITNWIKELLTDGLITESQLILAGKKASRSSFKSNPVDTRSITEQHLADENLRLRAEVDFLKKLLSSKTLDSQKV